MAALRRIEVIWRALMVKPLGCWRLKWVPMMVSGVWLGLEVMLVMRRMSALMGQMGEVVAS